MRTTALKIAGIALLVAGASASCFALATPEIDAATGANALALVTGALLIIRSRRR